MALNLLPARQQIVDADGLATPEFARFFNQLFDRVGRFNGLSNDDLALLASFGESPAQSQVLAAGLHDDAYVTSSVDASAAIAQLRAEVESLRVELASLRDGAALAADAKSYAAQLETSYAFDSGYQVNWASPGAIGFYSPSTGKFTTVESTVATGTAPFKVASTTKVTNLYADRAASADSLTLPSSYPANATDLPTCIALANALKTAALAKGL